MSALYRDIKLQNGTHPYQFKKSPLEHDLQDLKDMQTNIEYSRDGFIRNDFIAPRRDPFFHPLPAIPYAQTYRDPKMLRFTTGFLPHNHHNGDDGNGDDTPWQL